MHGRRGGAWGVPGGHCPTKILPGPPVPPKNFPRDVMSLHWSPTQSIDSSPCCKTGPSSVTPKWKCLAPPLHGRHTLYFKLRMHGRIHFYRRPQVVHPCLTQYLGYPIALYLAVGQRQNDDQCHAKKREKQIKIMTSPNLATHCTSMTKD